MSSLERKIKRQKFLFDLIAPVPNFNGSVITADTPEKNTVKSSASKSQIVKSSTITSMQETPPPLPETLPPPLPSISSSSPTVSLKSKPPPPLPSKPPVGNINMMKVKDIKDNKQNKITNKVDNVNTASNEYLFSLTSSNVNKAYSCDIGKNPIYSYKFTEWNDATPVVTGISLKSNTETILSVHIEIFDVDENDNGSQHSNKIAEFENINLSIVNGFETVQRKPFTILPNEKHFVTVEFKSNTSGNNGISLGIPQITYYTLTKYSNLLCSLQITVF